MDRGVAARSFVDRGITLDMAALARNWWLIAIRGAAAIVFGILAFVLPGVTLAALILLFGVYALLDGILNLVAAATGRGGSRAWWVLVVEGLVSVAAAVVAFAMPGVTALALIYLIGAWAIVTGVLEIIAAVRLRREIRHEWVLALSGILSVVFGVLVMLFPGAGALVMVLWIGVYAVVFGALLLVLAFKLRGLNAAEPVPIRRAA